VPEAKSKTVELLSTPQVQVERGVPVNVEVPAKGATGHVWTVQADPSQVRVLAHTSRPSEDSFGGGGVEVFTLEPLTQGHSTITFQLGAPWKKNPSEEHQLDLDVFGER
jgi:predicted secreted protein